MNNNIKSFPGTLFKNLIEIIINHKLDAILENISRILAARRKLSVALTYMMNQNLNSTLDTSLRGCTN